jgi:hypothetical protein
MIGPIITAGLGAFSSAWRIITRGFGIKAVSEVNVLVVLPTVDCQVKVLRLMDCVPCLLPTSQIAPVNLPLVEVRL